MNRRRASRARRSRALDRFQGSAAKIGLGASLVLGALLLLAWQGHEIDQLRRARCALEAEHDYTRAAKHRAYARWCELTERENVLRRARAELGLVEAGTEPRLVLALPGAEPSQEPSGLLGALARNLDRVATIRGAVAGEVQP